MNWKIYLEDSLEDGFFFIMKEWNKIYIVVYNKIVAGFMVFKEVVIVEVNIYFYFLNKDMLEFFLLFLGKVIYFLFLLDIIILFLWG